MTNTKGNGLRADAALAIAEDYLHRARIPFMALGDTARHIVERGEDIYGAIDVKEVELGVFKRHLTPDCLSLLKAVCPSVIHNSKQLRFTHDGVDVKIKVIHRKYDCLNNLDTKFYKVTEYQIPNPFAKYWKIRGIIQ